MMVKINPFIWRNWAEGESHWIGSIYIEPWTTEKFPSYPCIYTFIPSKIFFSPILPFLSFEFTLTNRKRRCIYLWWVLISWESWPQFYNTENDFSNALVFYDNHFIISEIFFKIICFVSWSCIRSYSICLHISHETLCFSHSLSMAKVLELFSQTIRFVNLSVKYTGFYFLKCLNIELRKNIAI
jgi:hypothetical protein